MFFSVTLFSKKGSLAKIWLAAHKWDKNVSKKDIDRTDIKQSVSEIVKPNAPLALRVSGQLLLGVVRIYSKKLKYLQDDASEALTRIKLSFRPLELAEEVSAPVRTEKNTTTTREKAITLADNLEDLDLEFSIPDIPLEELGDITHGVLSGGGEDFLEVPMKYDADTAMLNMDLSHHDEDQIMSLDHGFDLERPRRDTDASMFGNSLIDLDDAGLDFDMNIGVDKDDGATLDFEPFDFDAPSIQGEDNMSLNISVVSEAPQFDVIRVAPVKKRRLESADSRTQISERDQPSERELLLARNERQHVPLTKRGRILTNLSEILQGPGGFDMAVHTCSSTLVQHFSSSLGDTRIHRASETTINDEQDFDLGDFLESPEIPEATFDDDHEMGFDLPEELGEFNGEGHVPGESELEGVDDKIDEDSGWSQRTRKAFSLLENKSKKGESVALIHDLLENKTRRAASIMFHELLVLKSKGLIDLEQRTPYEEVNIQII